MYKNFGISVVIPVYNEQKLIIDTLSAIPSYVDKIYVVDDGSTDSTTVVVREYKLKDNRVELLEHKANKGPGAAIITGYKKSAFDGHDVAVVIGGDNQMGLEYLPDILEPLINNEADYVKGNRFLKGRPKEMPFIRLFGNIILSLMTKISSGYWHIGDTQDGYTAISRKAIKSVDWSKAWQGYGYVSDFLIRFNTYGLKVKDVYRKEVYQPNEQQSKIIVSRYIFTVGPMIMRGFFWRLKERYIKKIGEKVV